MRGFSIPSTKQDVLNNLEVAPEETKKYLRDQLQSREIWMTERSLKIKGSTYLDDEGNQHICEEDEPYIEDATHKISELKDENDVVIERVQLVYTTDPNWYVSSRLNMTYEEVMDIINS